MEPTTKKTPLLKMNDTNKLDGAALISEAAATYYKAGREPGTPGKLRSKLLKFAGDQKPSTRDMIEAGKNIARMIDCRRNLFRKACNKISTDQLGLEIFDDDDSYEVDGLEWIDKDPGRFVQSRFVDDFDRLTNQQLERKGAASGG